MEYTRLGTTDITILQLCTRDMSFGKIFSDFHQWVIDREATQAVITRALELGVNLVGTANIYSHGTSEEFIGTSLENLGIKHEDVVLANKVYLNEEHLSYGAIEREIDGTLKRLGTDYFSPCIIHRFDYATPVKEALETLDTFVCSGRVRALGTPPMYTYQLHIMQVTTSAHGWTRFSSMQNHYNLLYREDERGVIPVCYQYGMSLTPYSPLASGYLTRPTWDSDSARSTSDAITHGKYDHGRETDVPIIKRVAELAQHHQVAMADVALAQLWARGVVTPIVGCLRPSRVDDAVRALGLTLIREEITFLEEPYVPHELVDPLTRPEDVSQR